jgi:hypothetical protein
LAGGHARFLRVVEEVDALALGQRDVLSSSPPLAGMLADAADLAEQVECGPLDLDLNSVSMALRISSCSRRGGRGRRPDC